MKLAELWNKQSSISILANAEIEMDGITKWNLKKAFKKAKDELIDFQEQKDEYLKMYLQEDGLDIYGNQKYTSKRKLDGTVDVESNILFSQKMQELENIEVDIEFPKIKASLLVSNPKFTPFVLDALESMDIIIDDMDKIEIAN